MIRRIISWFTDRGRDQRARAEALIARGLRSEEDGRRDEALGHYRAAVSADPGYPAAYVNLGVALESAGEAAAALQAWQRAAALEPGQPAACFNLGRAALGAGDTAGAEQHLLAALRSRPDFADAHIVLAAAQEARGDDAAALASLGAALALRPRDPGAWRNLGLLHARLQRWPQAAEAFRNVLHEAPEDAEVSFWLGNALVRDQRPEEAEAAYRAAIRVRPGYAEALCNLGNLLADRGMRDEAALCFERALQERQDLADAHVGLGNLLAGAQRPAEAAQRYRRALALQPGHPEAWTNLGGVLKDQGAWREACEAYTEALRHDPASGAARWSLAVAQLPLVREPGDDLPGVRARFEEALGALERWFDAERAAEGWRAVGVQQPFGLAYQEEDNRALLERYGALCARLMAPWQAAHAPAGGRRPRHAPLRVGVVSQFFRDHSVWHAIVRGWFAHLDPARYALQAYCLDPHEDGETRFARAHAARFEQGHAGLPAWVRAIEAGRPDVLLYPEIGMDPLSVRLAAMRLAPVQAASWGHPETTGLPTIDAYLSAQGMEPPGAQAHYTERLVALPGLGCTVQRPRDEAAAPIDLRSLGLEPGVPLLVCPGAPFKYAPEHDAALAQIAARLGRCQLVCFEHRVAPLSVKLHARMHAAFARHGVDAARCVRVVPWQAPGAFHALLRAADVYLDTIGFSGFNTALQAVAAGLPVVTREGRFLRGRLASGILRRIGLDEFVADDEAGYVDRAVRLATEAGTRDDVRGRMAAARARLYDDLEPVRALERFLDQGV